MSDVNNTRIALVLFALLAFSGSWAAGSDPADSGDGGVAPLHPFDLEPDGDSTIAVEYHITA